MSDSEVTEHISASELSGFLDGDLQADTRQRVEAHLDSCAQCRQEMVEVRRIAASYRPMVPAGNRWIPATIGLALAAGLAGILLVPTVRPRPGSPVLPVRGGAAASEGRGRIDGLIPPAGAEVTRDRITFAWHPASADVYRLTVLTDSGDPVWSYETTDTSAVLPVGTTLAPGAYFWRVDAIADGITATTGARRFLVGP